jgi:hypothetical protein
MFFMMLIVACGIGWIGCGEDSKGTDPDNLPPVILSITAVPDTFYAYQLTTVMVIAEDPDDDNLNYSWEAHSHGSWLSPVSGGANAMSFTNCCAISEPRSGVVLSIVDDGRGGEVRDSITVWVIPEGK